MNIVLKVGNEYGAPGNEYGAPGNEYCAPENKLCHRNINNLLIFPFNKF